MSAISQSKVKDIFSPVRTKTGTLDSEKLINHLYQAIDWVALIEGGFKDPDFPEEPFRFLPWQKKAIRIIQYSPKKGFQALAPRGYAKTTTFQLAVTAACLEPPFPYHRVEVAYISIGLDESLRALRELKRMISHSKYAHLIKLREEKRQITFQHNGSFIKAFPQSEGIRGGRYHYVVFDEWSRIRDDLFGAIRPTLRKRGIKEIGGSTPFGAAGDFYEQWYGEQYTEELDPYDRIEVQDIKEYDHDTGELIYFKSEIPWIKKKDYMKEVLQLGPMMARQELDADFLALGSTIIHIDWIRKSYDMRNRIPWVDHDYEIDSNGVPLCGTVCQQYKLKHGHSIHHQWAEIPKVLAGDFGRDRDFCVYMILSKWIMPSGFVRIIVHWIDRFRLTMDYDDIEDRAIHWMKRFNVKWGIFDGHGVGEPTLDHIEKKRKKAGLRVGMWKTMTSDIDQPGQKNIKFRLGYVTSSYTKSKQDLVELVVKSFNTKPMPQAFIPYHEGQRNLDDPRYNLWEFEKEMVNFQYKIRESKETKRRSLIYGVQSYHDDIFYTYGLGLLCLKFPMLGHFDIQYSVGKRKAKSTPPTERKRSTRRSYAVGKKKKPRRRSY